MDVPSQSAVTESLSRKGAVASSCEESGWTEYLEDFMASDKERDTSGGGGGGGVSGGSFSAVDSEDAGGSSVVSDAASCVFPWKAPPAACGDLQGSSGCKKLKRGTRLGHGELEDTASSPASSSKVNNFNGFDATYARMKNDYIIRDSSQEIRASAALSEERLQRGYEGTSGMDFAGRERSSHLAKPIKAKELRLVPMSMLVRYVG